MGLDITAYKKAVRLDPQPQPDDDDAEDYLYETYTNLWKDYEPLGQADGMEAGWYQTEPKGFDFRAGSYSGYSVWREWLAQWALGIDPHALWAELDDSDFAEKYKDKPFVELICFSDCEGFIGPLTSAKLAKDFALHDHEAQDAPDMDGHPGYNYRKYQEWQKAFELAAGEGVVKFH